MRPRVRAGTAAVLALTSALPASAEAQSILQLRSGNSDPGSPDALVTVAAGPIDSAFPQGSLGPTLFADAVAGPSALVLPGLAANWLPMLPSDPLARWISTTPDPYGSGSGIFAIPFVAPANTISGSLSLELAIDNQLGTSMDAGLWLNGGPVIGSQLIGPYGTDYYSIASSFIDLDLTGLIQPGENHLFLYCADTDSAAGIMFSAKITLVTAPVFTSLGGGLVGMAGIPTVVGSGSLVPASPVLLALSDAKPFSLSWLVVGISQLDAPFKGGVMVPNPNLFFTLTTDFFGASSFGGLWPPGVPSGFTTYFQWWIQDPAGPKGFAASNALAGTTP